MTTHRFEPALDAHLVDAGKMPEIARCTPALLKWCRAHHGDNDVLVTESDRLTYREADDRSAAFARQLLASGVVKGTRVGMLFPNSVEFLVTWLAITRIGAVAVPLSTFSTSDEIRRTARHSDMALLISAERYLNHDYVAKLAEAFPTMTASTPPHFETEAPYLRRIWFWADTAPAWAQSVPRVDSGTVSTELLAAVEQEVTPADLMTIIYTSGSTADPKGVMHTHGAIMRQGAKIAASYPYRPDERILTPMPMFWVGGLTLNLLNLMHVGGALAVPSSTEAHALLDFIESKRVTGVMCWPHTVQAMTDHPSFASRDLSAMRTGQLQVALPEDQRVPPWVHFGSALGMTETCGPHAMAHFHFPERLRGSYGTPMPGMESRIVDPVTGADVADGEVGVLWVRGDSLMSGLVKREREDVFTEDGWYIAGDLCSFRERHLFFHGRADDMIKTAGANVAPAEVEHCLAQLPEIQQAYVTGLADGSRGAVVGAVLVPAAGCEIDLEHVRRHARAHLSAFKVPRVMIVVGPSELPMLSSGKIDRRQLIARLAAHRDDPVVAR